MKFNWEIAKRIFIFLLISGIVYGFYYLSKKDGERDLCHSYTKGVVVKIDQHRWKGYITYEYYINGKSYGGYQRYGGKLNKNAELYKEFCVKFCPNDEENSEILLDSPILDSTNVCEKPVSDMVPVLPHVPRNMWGAIDSSGI